MGDKKKKKKKRTSSTRAPQRGPGPRPVVRWAPAPAPHDYPAAASYLTLLCGAPVVTAVTALLEQAPTTHQHAKDILRAARLALLGTEDPEVAKDLAKIAAGIPLAPVLLVRGDLGASRAVEVADGYHRVCASYHVNEDTEIPCRVADLPVAG